MGGQGHLTMLERAPVGVSSNGVVGVKACGHRRDRWRVWLSRLGK